MPPPLIQLTGIRLTFGGKNLLDGADLSVSPGERICLVGRNGSGKSTLLKVAAGQVEADAGTCFVQPGIRIGVLAQEPDFSAYPTTLAFAAADLPPDEGDHAARFLLEALGLTGQEPTSGLSGGEARRAALARVLAPQPDVLLLDEPTNHLDLPAIEWLEQELLGRQAALVLISHDRRFLERLSRATIWLDRGTTRRIDRGFGHFEAWRDQILAEEEAAQHKLGRKIADEEHWLRYGVTARRKRNVRRLENLHTLRREKRDHVRAAGAAQLVASEEDKGGKLVIEAEGLAKRYGERAIVRDFSIRILKGDRIGLVGPNGAGKTTLLSLMTGTLEPDSGLIRLGAGLAIASLEQRRDSLDPETSLADALTGGGTDTLVINGQPKNVIGYMKDFLFPPEKARTPLKVLSGGERARLMLARALARPSNLLVLDEPTNDLDLETLDVLQELLDSYAGTVLLISHDRDFLDRIVERVIVPEGNGKWRVYAGGYSDMLTQRGAEIVLDKPKAAKAESAESDRPVSSPAASARKKLTLQQLNQLESLPSAMEKLRVVIGKLQVRLDDPELYARDRKTFDETMALLEKAHAELGKMEERWLELEILREEAAG
ncbi:ATP-binding cassette domain-containing protein [Rhabdaerophilum sp. SD176]|uniref:ABC-F family ATP-binding cassette domain-containing protein n=1 Tax=Rhabdaerophilum sp. SD176 TaxID=2983548 RepID=UPI0024DF3F14|nr:ATP-binding cassette domain-containing protein [Rhabdaerophilum sp. SD176]